MLFGRMVFPVRQAGCAICNPYKISGANPHRQNAPRGEGVKFFSLNIFNAVTRHFIGAATTKTIKAIAFS